MQLVEQKFGDDMAFLYWWWGTRQLGVVNGQEKIQGNQLQAMSRVDKHVNMSSGIEIIVSFAVKIKILLISAGLCACSSMQKQLNWRYHLTWPLRDDGDAKELLVSGC